MHIKDIRCMNGIKLGRFFHVHFHNFVSIWPLCPLYLSTDVAYETPLRWDHFFEIHRVNFI